MKKQINFLNVMVDNGVVLVGARGVFGLHVRFARVLLLTVTSRNQARLPVPNIITVQNYVIG
jgi:hypothetical protein